MLDVSETGVRYEDVTSLAELRENFVTLFKVAGRAIVIARTPAGIGAFDGTCTHARFHFGTSRLVADCEIECPMHGARFDATTGAVTKGPAKLPLPRIDAVIENGIVRVRVDWAETP
jgi:3-phenylpropionate/trans-cinnamate dioxygenase ferredoxin subunit